MDSFDKKPQAASAEVVVAAERVLQEVEEMLCLVRNHPELATLVQRLENARELAARVLQQTALH